MKNQYIVASRSLNAKQGEVTIDGELVSFRRNFVSLELVPYKNDDESGTIKVAFAIGEETTKFAIGDIVNVSFEKAE